MDSVVALYTVEPTNHPEFSPFQYYLDQSGKLAIDFAKQYLNLNINLEYDAFFQRPDGSSQWVEPDQSLRQQGIQDGFIMALIPSQNLNNNQSQPMQMGIQSSTYVSAEGQYNNVPDQNQQMNNAEDTFNYASYYTNDNNNNYNQYYTNNFNSAFFNSVNGFQSSYQSTYGYAQQESDESQYTTGMYAKFNISDFYETGEYDPSQFQSTDDSSSAQQVGVELDININDQISEFQTMMGFGAMTDNSNAGESESITMETHFMFNKESIQKVYRLNMSHDEMLTAALAALGKYQDDKYGIFISLPDGTDAKWVEPEKFLEDVSPGPNYHVYIIKLLKPILVHSKHFKSQKLTLDISKKVCDLVEDIANFFKIGSFRCYTLCTVVGKRAIYLSIDKSIPEQTRSINEVFFARQYFLFTMEDLETFVTAEIAYKDAVECSNFSEIEFSKENLLKYTALRMNADPKFDPKHIPDDISPWMPGYLAKKGKGQGRGPVVQQFFEQNGTVNKFNAYRKFIKLCRKLVGFAERKYECKVTAQYQKQEFCLDPAVVYISPYRLVIHDGLNGNLEEKISFTEIVQVQCAQDMIITFSPKRDVFVQYVFSGPKVESMAKSISRYREITNMILQDRSKRYSNTGDFRKLINKKSRISLFTSNTIDKDAMKEFEYDKKFTGSILRRAAEYYLSIPHKDDRVLMIHLMDDLFCFMKDTDVIQSLCLQNGMTLYLLEPKYNIKYIFPDNTSIKMETTITMPISDIVPLLFKEKHQQAMLGYTLWYHGIDGQLHPLDSRKTIPEQVSYFKKLFLKRRFYILSKEVLQALSSAIQTLHDCRNYLIENKIKVDSETALKLALYSLYALGVKNIKKDKQDLKQLVPPTVSVSSSLQRKFDKMIQESQDMTQMSAARKYIGIVRKIDGFGAEEYPFYLYRDDAEPPHTIKDGSFVITPLGLSVLDKKGKVVIEKITYHSLKQFIMLGNNYILKYQHPPKTGKMIYVNISSDFAFDIDVVISYNLRLMRQVMLLNREREKQKREEIILRCSGGWKDENGVVHGPMVDLRYGLLSDNILKQAIWFDLDITQEELARQLLDLLPHDPKVQYATMIQVFKGVIHWLKPGMKLKEAQPYRDSIVYFHPAFAKIKFISPRETEGTMTIQIETLVCDLIPKVGLLLDVEYPQGYTFFYKEGNELIPLDTQKSIPEQTRDYSVLYFQRYYFVINKAEFQSKSALSTLYWDTKLLILSGKVDMRKDVAYELLVYALNAETREKVTEHSLPENFKSLLPYGFPIQKEARKEIIDMIKHKPCKSHTDAKLKYIALARMLPTFGAIDFDVIYMKFKKDTRADIPAILVCNAQSVRIVRQDLQKVLQLCEYRHFIRTECVANELSVKFSTDDAENSVSILCVLDKPELASSFITIVTQLYNLFLDLRREGFNPKKEDVNTSIDRVVLITKRWDDSKRELNIAYDMRYKGSDVRARAVRALHLDPRREYTPLLRLAKDEYRWIRPDDILGHHFPCDNMYITIFSTNVKIIVKYKDMEIELVVNITQPIHMLAPLIGECFNIEYPTGFTLFYESPGHSPVPLDLYYSIPEQYSGKFEFLFIRRFLAFTHQDRYFPYICRCLYPDVYDDIMDGVPALADSKATELAIYSIYAKNKENDPAKIKIPNTLDLYPRKTSAEQIHEKYITDTIRNGKVIHKDIAMQKYIGIAKQSLHFGCTIFKVKLCDDMQIQVPQKARVSIGPLGVHIYGRVNIVDDGQEKPIDLNEKITYNYICDFNIMIDHVILRVSMVNSRIRTFTISARHVKEMFVILRSFKMILYPYLQRREEIQKVSPELQEIIDNKNGLVAVFVSKKMFIPDPPEFLIPRTLEFEKIVMLLCHFLVLPYEPEKYALIHYKNNEYTQLKRSENLMSVDCQDGDGLIILEVDCYAQFMNISGNVIDYVFNVYSPLYDILPDVCKQLGYGTWIGHTIFVTQDDGSTRALDIQKPLAMQANLTTPLLVRRRFFLFSLEMLSQPDILFAVYKDCKYLVTKKMVMVSDDILTQLLILSLYATAEKPEDVPMMISQFKKEDWTIFIPANFDVTEGVKKKLISFLPYVPILSRQLAMFYYIGTVMDLKGFNDEVFMVTINTIYAQIDSILYLNPWRVFIQTEEDGTIAINTTYNWLINHECSNEKIIIRFMDQSNNNQSEFHLFTGSYKDINTFLSNIIFLYQLEEFSNISNILEGSAFINNGQRVSLTMNNAEIQLEVNNNRRRSSSASQAPPDLNNPPVEEDNYNPDDETEFNFIHTFDDNITSIDYNIDTPMITFDDYNIDDVDDKIEDVEVEYNKLEIPDIDDREDENNKVQEDNEPKEQHPANLLWRANEEGLNISRATNILNEIQVNLDVPEETIVHQDPTELFQKLAMINDQVSNFVESTENEDLREQFSEIYSHIDSIVTTTQNLVQTNQSFEAVSEDIKSQIQSAISIIKPAIDRTNNAKVVLIEKIQDEMAMNNYNNEKVDVPPLAKDLIGISEVSESITNELLFTAKQAGIDVVSFVQQIQNTSSTLTILSGSIADAQSSSQFNAHIQPHIKTVGNYIVRLEEIVKQAKEKNIELPNTEKSLKKLKKLYMSARDIVLVEADVENTSVVEKSSNASLRLSNAEKLSANNTPTDRMSIIIEKTSNTQEPSPIAPTESNPVSFGEGIPRMSSLTENPRMLIPQQQNNAKYIIVNANDEELDNTIDICQVEVQPQQMQQVPPDTLSTCSIAIQSINHLRDLLIQLSNSPKNDQLRFEAEFELQKVDSDIFDALMLLHPLTQTDQTAAMLYQKFYEIILQIRHQMDVISTRNITPLSVSKINNDLTYMVNHVDNLITPETMASLPQDQQERVRNMVDYIKDSYYDIQQAQSALEANAANGIAVIDAQKNIVELKSKLPEFNQELLHLSAINKNVAIPVIIERLSMNIDKAIQEKPAEDVSNIPYLLKFQEAMLSLQELINELVLSSDQEKIKADIDLSTRAKMTIEKAQQTYLNMVELRNQLLEDPYNDDLIKDALDLVREGIESMTEISNLSKRIADVSQNFKIPTINEQISTKLEEVVKVCDNSKQNEKVSMISGPPQKIEKPTVEQMQSVIDAVTHLAQVVQFYISLPEVDEDDEKRKDAVRLYEYMSSVLVSMKEMGENPTEDIFEYAIQISRLADKFQQIAMTVPTYTCNENADQLIPYGIQLLQTVKPVIIAQEQERPKMEEIVPNVTPELIKSSLVDVSKTLGTFNQKIYEVTNSETAQKNQIVQKTFTDWSNSINATIERVNAHINSPNYNIKQAKLDKEALNQLQQKVNLIPMNVRRNLDEKLITDITASISDVVDKTNVFVTMIKQLPTAKKIEIKVPPAPEIKEDDDIEDTIVVVQKQAQIINDTIQRIAQSPQIAASPNAQAVVQQMSENLKALQTEALNAQDEKVLYQRLNMIKEQMPSIISNAELIEPIIESPQFTSILKSFNDSSNSITKLITVPHMNKATSVKFIQHAQPQLQNFVAALAATSELAEVKDNPSLKSKFEALIAQSQTIMKELPTLKPRQAQLVCDEIYSATCGILPILYDSNFDQLEEAAQNIALVSEVFTSLPKTRKPKSAQLIIKDPVMKQDNVKQAVQESSNVIMENETSIPQHVIESIIEDLNVINDHKDSLPVHIVKSLQAITPQIKQGNTKSLIDCVRLISVCEKDYELRNQMLSDIATAAAVNAAQQVIDLQNSIKALHNQIVSNPTKFNAEAKYYDHIAQSSIKESDAKLLTETKSFSAALVNRESLNDASQAISLLLDSIKDNESVKAISQTLSESNNNLIKTLHQFDMCLGEIFLSQLDKIVTACDNTIIQNPGTASPAMKQFVRQTFPLLKNTNRSIELGPSELVQISNLYDAFNKSVVPTLTNIPPAYKDEIAAATKALTPMKPLISSWKTPIPLTGKQELRNVIRGTAVQLENIASSEDNVNINIPDVYAMSQNLQIAAIRAKSAGIEMAKIDPLVQQTVQNQKLLDQAVESNDVEKVKEIAKNLAAISSQLKLEITNIVPIVDANETSVKLINPELYLATIADASCLNVAKTAAVLMNQYKTKLDTLQKTKPEIIKKDITTPELIARSNIESQSSISVALNPIISITSTQVPTIVQSVQETSKVGAVSALSVPIQQQPKLVESNIEFMMAQRLEGIRQKQLNEFPDVVKMLSKPIDVKLSEDTITNAMMSIQQQTQLFANEEELRKTISRLTPDDIIVQQHALKLMTENIQLKKTDANIAEAAQLVQSKKVELLEAVAMNDEKPDLQLKSVEDVNRSVQRGFSTVNLVETLQALQQQIIAKTPELLKYVRSPEGIQLLKAPIPPTKLVDVQQRLIQTIKVADSPEQLDVILTNSTPDDMITTMRIIDSSLNLLSSDDVYNIIADPNIETTPIGVLKATNNLLQEKLKANEDHAKMMTLIQTETVAKSQEFVMDALQRLNLAQSLMTIQQFHTSVVPHLQQKLQAVDVSKPVNKELVDMYIPMISQELEYVNHPQQFAMAIPQLNPEDVEQQQEVLASLAATLATSKKSAIKYDLSNMKNTTVSLLDKVQNDVSDNLADKPEQLHLVKVKNDQSYDFFAQHQQLLNACQQTLEMGSVLQVIRQKVPNIDQLLTNGQAENLCSAKLNDSSLHDTRDKMLVLQQSTRESFKSLNEAIQNVKMEDLVVIFSLMSTQMMRMKDLDAVVTVVKSKSMQSRIFDKSLLIQQTPRKVETKKLVTDTQNVNNDLSESMKDLSQAQLCSSIANLMKIRQDAIQVDPKEKVEIVKSLQQNPEKLAQLQQQTYQQLYQVAVDPEQVKQSVSKEDKEAQVAQAMLLQHLSMAAAAPQYIAAACKDIDYTKIPSIEQSGALSQVAITNATQISGKLIGFQRALLTQDPSQLLKMASPDIATIDAINVATKENLERSQLRTKMSAIQRDIVSKNPQIVQAIHQSTISNPNVSQINLNTDEVKLYQGEIKTLVGTNASPIVINNMMATANQDQMVKKMAVLNDLIQITKPANPVVTTFSNIAGLDSILNTQINADIAVVSAAPLVTKNYRSEQNIVANAAQRASEVVPIMAQFSALPISECKNIFATTNTRAIEIVSKLMTTKSNSEREELVDELSKQCPKLVASLTRHLAMISDSKLRSQLIADPAQILQIVNEISSSSSDLSNPQNQQRFRQMCTALLQNLKNLYASLVHVNVAKTTVTAEPETTTSNVLESFEKLVAAIDTNDIEKISQELIDFTAMKVKRTALNETSANIDPIIDQISQIDKAVQRYYITNSAADGQLTTVLNQVKSNSIQILKRETVNVFKQVADLGSIAQIDGYFTQAKSDINDATNKLILSVQARNPEMQKDAINLIIKSFASCESAMYRGFELSNNINSVIATDYLSMVCSGSTATRNIIEVAKSRAVSSTVIRRATRSYNRIIESMSSMLQDTSKTENESKSQLDLAKVGFVNALAGSVKTMSSALATCANCKVPEVYLSFLATEKPVFDQIVPTIVKIASQVTSCNTNKQAGADFSSLIDSLAESINDFQKCSFNPKTETEQSAHAFLKVAAKTQKILVAMNSLTDVIPKTPDMESAELLPKEFKLPHVPNTENIDIHHCLDVLIQSIKDFNEKKTVFFQIVNHPQATNQYIVQSFQPFMQQMSQTITQVLACSATAYSLDHQSSLASAAGLITTDFSSFLSALRNRFLLIGDFDANSSQIMESISNVLDQTIKTATEASELAKNSEGEFKAIIDKLHPAIVAINASKTEYEKYKEQIENNEQNRFTELAKTTIIEPCLGMSTAAHKLLLFSCGKLDAVDNFDNLAEFAMKLIATLNEAMETANTVIKNRPPVAEAFISPCLSSVGECGKTLAQTATKNAEAQKLLDAVLTLANAILNLASTTAATAARKSQPKAQAKSGSGSGPSIAVKSNLLKRLDLEARVIKARTLLEKYEKDFAKLN
ncbi:hypothetical protein TVAG_252220 [Trichomonas vaginalis G3]|uniref:FERM domain-containing protein n=1 Tax=Trichomonas vaginalis (strain ATCC PRA-98 / G3) TaxID=412133 RepID=A2DVW4_TRIV3|nr:Second domain of FERM family [Trichomonas vaginalis G3]EAY15409.1 hypothetical protein TVAG_252220 [Trichomonas vaginalis G3]KAI5499627.1 Second domain of FERM family [Trichomonas vaginalis G3]|eukprot:XP_001327632.1 hypothetical protein [Trichomonas vaginalis G3]